MQNKYFQGSCDHLCHTLELYQTSPDITHAKSHRVLESHNQLTKELFKLSLTF